MSALNKICKVLSTIDCNFSYRLQHTAGARHATGQSLISPGSCMRQFRSRPFIECNGLGRCNYFATAISYWLSVIDDYRMFEKPEQQTLKADQVSKVSR